MNSVTSETTPSSRVPDAADAGQRIVIPVLAEQAQVHLQRERTGTVRVRKVVHQVTEPVVGNFDALVTPPKSASMFSVLT